MMATLTRRFETTLQFHFDNKFQDQINLGSRKRRKAKQSKETN